MGNAHKNYCNRCGYLVDDVYLNDDNICIDCVDDEERDNEERSAWWNSLSEKEKSEILLQYR